MERLLHFENQPPQAGDARLTSEARLFMIGTMQAMKKESEQTRAANLSVYGRQIGREVLAAVTDDTDSAFHETFFGVVDPILEEAKELAVEADVEHSASNYMTLCLSAIEGLRERAAAREAIGEMEQVA